MPWREASVVDQRREFVTLARAGGNIRELCRRYRISSKTGYKWLVRFSREGPPGLGDRSRRPHHSPRQVGEGVEGRVVSLRREHPRWGGRKLRRRLQNLGCREVPAASTITAILRRRELLGEGRGSPHAFVRFEAEAPNDLWQMDFKGHFATLEGRCHPPHGLGRSLPLLHHPPSLPERARRHRQNKARNDLSTLWPAPMDADGQRKPVGLRLGASQYATDGLAGEARRAGRAFGSLSPSDGRQRRALPSISESRGHHSMGPRRLQGVPGTL